MRFNVRRSAWDSGWDSNRWNAILKSPVYRESLYVCIFFFFHYDFINGREGLMRSAWEWLRINICIQCDVILNVGYVNESSLFTREPLLYTRANILFGRKNRLHEKYIIYIYIVHVDLLVLFLFRLLFSLPLSLSRFL